MFAQRLKELRKKNQLTQIDLAKILGVSNGTVAMWETEKRTPDTAMLNRLCKLFNCRMDFLLGYTDDDLPYPPANFFRPGPSKEYEEVKRLQERVKNGEITEEEEKAELSRIAHSNPADPENILSDYNKLDDYGKSAVRRLIADELKRCREQGTLR